MFPTIPATPHCAEYCCRLEIVPSRRIAAAWLAWLVLLCAAVLCAVALPLLVRSVVCVACATSIVLGVRPFILLRGANAVRALEWSDAGGLTAYVGLARAAVPAGLAAGTFRLGVWLLILRLQTPDGLRSVLVDGAVHDAAEFRRLCRWLEWHSRPCSGPHTASTGTIRPKV